MRGALAARLWWALGYHGHDERARPHGGFPRWRREGRTVAFEVEPPPRPTSFVPRVRRERIATLEQVRDGGLALLDTRSRAEWEGTDRQWNRRGGHVPGAVHVEWSDAMTEDGRFRPTEELRALFADLPEGDAAAYCQACVRGAHGVLVARARRSHGARVRRLDGRVGQSRRHAARVRRSRCDTLLSTLVDSMLDEARLEEARAARDRYVELQHRADQGQMRLPARDPSPARHRRLAAEIADALGVSYQRVHQIVDPGAGKGAIKPGGARARSAAAPTTTWTCCRGPRVFICDACVERERAEPSPARRCAFCRRLGRARICGECLDLADEILAEAVSRRRRRRVALLACGGDEGAKGVQELHHACAPSGRGS